MPNVLDRSLRESDLCSSSFLEMGPGRLDFTVASSDSLQPGFLAFVVSSSSLFMESSAILVPTHFGRLGLQASGSGSSVIGSEAFSFSLLFFSTVVLSISLTPSMESEGVSEYSVEAFTSVSATSLTLVRPSIRASDIDLPLSMALPAQILSARGLTFGANMWVRSAKVWPAAIYTNLF